MTFGKETYSMLLDVIVIGIALLAVVAFIKFGDSVIDLLFR